MAKKTNEEEETEEQAEEDEEKVPSVGRPTQSEDLISKANAAAARMEEANKRHEELLQRQEEVKVKETLGGVAEAGTQQKEETPEEYTKRVMANDI